MANLIQIDMRQMERQLRRDFGEVAKKAVPAAKKAALLRVSRSALSRAVRGAAKRARVKAKLIRARSANKPFKGGRKITINTAPIPLAVLGPKGRPPNQTRNGVRVMGHHFPKGFVWEGRRSHVFRRKGQPRYPIEEIRIPVEQEIRAAAPPATQRAVEQRWEKEFDHNFERQLKRIARRGRR